MNLSDMKNLPLAELTGSTKQVAWAETIRIEKMKYVRIEIRNTVNASDMTNATNLEQVQLMMEIYQQLADKTDAKYWIDIREQWPSHILRDMFNAQWAARLSNKAVDVAEEVAVTTTPDYQDANLADAETMIPNNGSAPLPIVGQLQYQSEDDNENVITLKQSILFDGDRLRLEGGEEFSIPEWGWVRDTMAAQIITAYPNLICSLLHTVQTDSNYIMVRQ